MMKKLLKIAEISTLAKSASFPNYQRYRLQILIAQIEDLSEYGVKILRPYLLHFPRNKLSESVTAE